MIQYTLKCDNGHSFESWFKTASAFETLQGSGMVNCAVCGSVHVEKAIMAPRVRPARNAATAPAEPKPRPLSEPASAAEQAVKEFRKKIEETSEDVGREFAREARAIHDGDAPERAIIGEAKPAETKALLEDGIAVAPLPWTNRKSN